MKSSAIALVFFGMLVLRGFGGDGQQSQRSLDGVWSGEDTNGRMDSVILSIRLTTNGQGAVLDSGKIGISGTFTYTCSNREILFFTNDTPRMTGTLRYDAPADGLIYQENASVAAALGKTRSPVLLTRDTNEVIRAFLDCIVGATNYDDLMTRRGHFFGSYTNKSGAIDTKSPVQTKQKAPVTNSLKL